MPFRDDQTYYYCLFGLSALVAWFQKSDPIHAAIPLFDCVDAILLSERLGHESSLDLGHLRSASTNVRYRKYVDLSFFQSPGVFVAPLAGPQIHLVENPTYEHSMQPSDH